MNTINPSGIGVTIKLDAKGRCCGRKPLSYKRQSHYYCTRCSAQFNIETLAQEPNFSWRSCKSVGFEPTHGIFPNGKDSDSYAKFLALTGLPRAILKWQHDCPFNGDRGTNEHVHTLLECRCFSSSDFLAAQDSIAVALDLERKADPPAPYEMVEIFIRPPLRK